MPVRYEKVPKEKFILRPQARQHEPEYLRRLSESLAKGQLQPVGTLLDYTVIWGNARVLAARMNPDIEFLMAARFEEQVSEREFQRKRFVENQLRQDLSNYEKAMNCVEYVKSEPNLTLKEIAADLGVDGSMPTRWLGIEKCIEEVIQAFAADKLTLNAMYAISQFPKEQQAQALAETLNGASVKKRMANGAKMSRLKCQMQSGVCVTLAAEGEGMMLSDVIETLGELLKSAKKAEAEQLDAKTWERVLKDKARG